MGNSSTKESRQNSRPSSVRQVGSPTSPAFPSSASAAAQQSPVDRLTGHIYSSRSGRSSRHDLSFLHIGRGPDTSNQAEIRRETKQDKEARRAERAKVERETERERSMREEGVDGGYLVTLGTYTGPEDFSKATVRQLQIERRLAPFWKGLNDYSDSWTEHQLVAAAKGLPIPAADEVPPDMARTGSQASNEPRRSDVNVNGLTIPFSSRSQSYQSDVSANLSASHPAFSHSGPGSPTNPTSTNSPFLRGRAKTLASLTTSSRKESPDLTPQEIRLSYNPFVNGQALEAYLYKDAMECPICFLCYPPYLNKTRCCDQPICSECFVQIKRPDPHPPEHEQPGQQRLPEEIEDQLVSEVAACPFCVTPEFGVAYEPPPFRRGLTYANQTNTYSLTSAMSSSTSLTSTGAPRRRTTSLSASAAAVITTDRVRPDWAKKLSDARAHALRRSAAATALHNAAYVLGNEGDAQLRGGFGLGRRRRTLFDASPSASGTGTPGEGGDGSSDLFPGRTSSRRNRVEDLEDLMMMEAIRLSLAAEEDRKKKEEKEQKQDDKKRAKEMKKEQKAAEKAARKHAGSSASLYPASANDSVSAWSSMARSSSNLGSQPAIHEEQHTHGKGKAPASAYLGLNPLTEPTSIVNTEPAGLSARAPQTAIEDPQRRLQEQRAHLQPVSSAPITMPPGASHPRQLSNTSSAASSFIDSATGSARGHSTFASANASGLDVSAGAQHDSGNSSPFRSATPPATGNTPGVEPMFNFRSLAAMIGAEDKVGGSEHVEEAEPAAGTAEEEKLKEPSPRGSPRMAPAAGLDANRRARGDSGESSRSAPPPIYVEHSPGPRGGGSGDAITPVPRPAVANADQKHHGDVRVLDHGRPEAAQ